jgi:anti-sigma B factor antagonist
VADEGALEIRRTVDPDGYARLCLKGEFDYVSSGHLLECLDQLKESGDPIRLDLSELEFIDSGGVRTVLRSVRDAETDGRRLEIDPQISWQVKQVFDVLGLDAVLWPPPGAGN